MKPLIRVVILSCLVALAAHAENLEYGPPFVIHGNFRAPAGLAVDGTRLFVADSGNHRFKVARLATIPGTPAWTEYGFVATRTTPEALSEPQGIAVDSAGNAYVVDTFGNEVQLYRWNAATSTYALDAGFAGTTRNSVAGIDIRLPRDIAVGTDGKVYLLDSGNDRILVADGPDDTSWAVLRANPDWSNPYGIDVAADGTLYVADTHNHRVVVISGGSETSFGSFGIGNSRFRFPRDVAVGTDGRIYVADTFNHRVAVFRADRSHYRNLGVAPLFATVQKIEVDASNRVFVLDSNGNAVIAFLGPVDNLPFDAYVRDFVGDPGAEPSDNAFILSSPDVLVRYHSDLDVASPAAANLELFAFEQPRFERNNYVYVTVRNRGTQPIANVTAKLYWADPGGTLAFPAAWSANGFYRSYTNASTNDPGNSLHVPLVPARQGSTDGVTVVGPLVWRPPAPEAVASNDGRAYLLVRLLHGDDRSEPGSGLDQVRLNNNISLRRAEISRGPFPVGDQDTLVVRVKFADIATDIDAATVETRVNETTEWIAKASYGLATVKPEHVGPVVLPHPRAHYAVPTRTLLVEMATDVLTQLPGSAFTRGTPETEDDIDRVILVVNDPAFTTDWATTGHWPYELAGTTRHLSVSVQGPSNTTFQYAHGLLHQFGLHDLYIHPNVDAPGLTDAAAGWDNMAQPFDGAHPLVWSKQLATWMTSHGGQILYIRRPPSGTPPRLGEPPIHVRLQTKVAAGEVGAVAIGLTEGATTFEDETQFYWVEARDPAAEPSDNVPEKGVLVYYVHKLVPQGEAPVIIRDPTPGTPRADAALAPSQELSPAGTGIRVRVESEVPSNAGYMVRIDYEPPPDDFNVYVRRGDPPWVSPDIWIDNPRDGNGFHAYDATGHTSAGPVTEDPLADVDNRIYARVHNHGPATAYDVRVVFKMSEPYHTVGGEPDFDPRGVRIIPSIPAGEYRDVYFVWRPVGVDDPHTCVRVALEPLPNDNNAADNEAQQNLTVRPSTTSSPYTPVKFNFTITNGEEDPQLVYFQSHGVPPAWQKAFSETKKLLAPDERHVGALTVKPHDDATVCTNQEFYVTGWTARGDTLIRLGGTTVNVALRNRTELTATSQLGACNEKRPRYYTHGVNAQTERALTDGMVPMDLAKPRRECATIDIRGCTIPPRPNEVIVVRYTDPAGNPIYREVMTDALGCYEDFLVVVEGGAWTAGAYYPGTQCSGPATASVGVFVPLPQTGDQDGDGLPDDRELHGDADGDGIVNQLDQDSDNDGVRDGDEPPGDADQDGLDNVVDPDSDNDGEIDSLQPKDSDGDGLPDPYDPDDDNDGIPDHRDVSDDEPAAGAGREIGFFWGYIDFDRDLPIRDLHVVGVRAGRTITSRWSVEAELATGTTHDAAGVSGRVWQANAHALFHLRPVQPVGWRVFAMAGVGALVFDGFTSGDRSATVNFGVGIKVPVAPRLDLRGDLKLLIGSDAYNSGTAAHGEATLGIGFRF